MHCIYYETSQAHEFYLHNEAGTYAIHLNHNCKSVQNLSCSYHTPLLYGQAEGNGDAPSKGTQTVKTAITTELFDEFAYYSYHYPRLVQYELLTDNAYSTLLQRPPNLGFIRRCGEMRAALGYDPPNGWTIASMKESMATLRSKILQRHQHLMENIREGTNVEYAVICLDHIEELQVTQNFLFGGAVCLNM